MATDKTQDIDLGMTRNEYDDPTRPFRAVLTLNTSKVYNGGLRSEARVYWIGNHSRQHAFGIGGGGDYSKTIAKNATARATQKAIDTLHAQTFTPEAIEALTADAKAHYANGLDKR